MTDTELERIYSRIADRAQARRKIAPADKPKSIRHESTVSQRIREALTGTWLTKNQVVDQLCSSSPAINGWIRRNQSEIESRELPSSGRGSRRREYRVRQV